MSRSCYTNDFGEDFPGQLELYRANVRRAVRSRKGQERLCELRDALLAMPVKELHANVFAAGTPQGPQVCGLGAWALARCGGDVEAARALARGDLVDVPGDDQELATSLGPLGWPRLLVLDLVYENDEGLAWASGASPATRYRHVLDWVQARIEVAP